METPNIPSVGGSGPTYLPPKSDYQPQNDANQLAVDLEELVTAFINNLGREGEQIANQSDINATAERLRAICDKNWDKFSGEQQSALQTALSHIEIFQYTDPTTINHEQLRPALASIKDLIRTF